MAARNDRMAFGVMPSNRAYKLRFARYVRAAEALADFASEHGDARPLDLLDLCRRKGMLPRFTERAGVAHRFRHFGVDIDRERFGRMHGVKQWRRVRANLEQGIPFGVAAFDAVVCEQILEHLSRPEPLVAECARVPRPGGPLILGVPIFPPGFRWVRAHVAPKLDRLAPLGTHSHVSLFTYQDVLALIEAQGSLQVGAARGFRFVSGGLVAPLENTRLFWRINRWLGARLPAFATEVQIVARRV